VLKHVVLSRCPFLVPTFRFLPDKAIDLVDEAAAKIKMEITSKPEILDEVDRKVRLFTFPSLILLFVWLFGCIDPSLCAVLPCPRVPAGAAA
jgi:hypothetical protein